MKHVQYVSDGVREQMVFEGHCGIIGMWVLLGSGHICMVMGGKNLVGNIFVGV